MGRGHKNPRGTTQISVSTQLNNSLTRKNTVAFTTSMRAEASSCIFLRVTRTDRHLSKRQDLHYYSSSTTSSIALL